MNRVLTRELTVHCRERLRVDGFEGRDESLEGVIGERNRVGALTNTAIGDVVRSIA